MEIILDTIYLSQMLPGLIAITLINSWFVRWLFIKLSEVLLDSLKPDTFGFSNWVKTVGVILFYCVSVVSSSCLTFCVCFELMFFR
jgi:hypothetical protein